MGARGRRGRRIARAALLALGLPLAAHAGPAGAPESSTGRLARHLASAPRLLGDPGGARERLRDLGVTLQLFSNHLGTWKRRGGASRGDETGHSASADLIAVADLQELAGWRGGTLLLHVKSQYDRNVNADVGALSDPYDDADFDEAVYVDELWLQQSFADDRLRLRLGFQEQQTVFDRNAFANSEDRQFLAAALDNDPLVPLPNALALNAIARVAPWLELAAGVADADNVPRRAGFDTAFDGADGLGVWAEAAARVRLPGARGPLEGTWRLGVFRDGRERDVLGSRDAASGLRDTRRGHPGVYLSVDQVLWRGERGARHLGLFLRAARADRDVEPFPVFGSLGLEAAGLVPGRGADRLGLAVHQRRPSSRHREATGAVRETGFELYWAASVLPWLVVTPDVQVVLDPGGRPAPTAVLAALRLRVTW